MSFEVFSFSYRSSSNTFFSPAYMTGQKVLRANVLLNRYSLEREGVLRRVYALKKEGTWGEIPELARLRGQLGPQEEHWLLRDLRGWWGWLERGAGSPTTLACKVVVRLADRSTRFKGGWSPSPGQEWAGSDQLASWSEYGLAVKPQNLSGCVTQKGFEDFLGQAHLAKVVDPDGGSVPTTQTKVEAVSVGDTQMAMAKIDSPEISGLLQTAGLNPRLGNLSIERLRDIAAGREASRLIPPEALVSLVQVLNSLD